MFVGVCFKILASKYLSLCELSEPSPFLQRTIFDEKNDWVHPINLQRNVFSEFHHLVSDLAQHDDRFHSSHGMLLSSFSALLHLVRCKLTKQETAVKWSATAEERFALRLL